MRLDRPVSDLWRERVEQHTQDSYAGVGLSKFPEDLRVYEHLLWLAAPTAVIEIGAQFGASALWFRDRLRGFSTYGRGTHNPLVISIDVEIENMREGLRSLSDEALEGIEMVEADVLDPALPDRIEAMLRPGERCFVIEDSAHVYNTTYAALAGFARFVPPDGFFVVEDGCVDIEEMRMSDWPTGVLPALRDWLATEEGREFEQRRDLELYGITCHPGGFLQRRQPAS
jgi:cephalosporin hydroxylase